MTCPRQPCRRIALALLGLLLAAGPAAGPAVGDEAAWAALAQGGHVALIRHATTTPGVGDPPGYRLDDCPSQRNLSDAGRAEARALGAAFRRRAVPVERVLSSVYCRCVETARLMGLEQVAVEPALANLFNEPEKREERTRSLRATVAAWAGRGTLVLVTHGANVLPLAGVSPQQAEVVVVKPMPGTAEGFRLVGRIAPPPG